MATNGNDSRLIHNTESWIKREDLGSRMPPFLPTFPSDEARTHKHYRTLLTCPLTPPDMLIDLGIPGWLRREDALKLYEIAYMTDGHVLELGCYQGLSTSILATAILDSRKRRRFLTAIDVDPACVQQTWLHLKAARSVLRVVQGDAEQLCVEFEARGERFGFVFVDHSHRYEDVAATCRQMSHLLSDGGFVLFHDFNDWRNNSPLETDYGVSDAVWDALDSQSFAFFGIFGCCALYRRTP